ncbi:MAG: D-Ala-D-Ala carboxypeptidase family metallohydrolase [Pseudoxanthomonas sp.]
MNPVASLRAVVAMIALPTSFAVAAADTSATLQERFSVWSRTAEAAGVERYLQYLQAQGLDAVLPMPSLLKSARSWRECDAREFALPPQEKWPQMLPTLRVLKQLRTAGLVDGSNTASGYRDETLNRCAGGSSASRHLANNALDFDLAKSPDNIARLCDFWRRQGPALKLGLGFYTNTAIHLDTSGYRTWGSDHTRRTSLCNSPAQPL